MRTLTPREEYELLEGRRMQQDQRHRAETIADLSDELRDVEESIAAWNDMVAMAEKRRAKIKERLTSLGVVGDLT